MRDKSVEMVVLFDLYGSLMTEKQRQFFDMYYNDDLSLAEIAENEGITRQGVRDAILRAESILVDAEAKLGLLERSEKLEKTVHTIESAVKEIKEINSEKYFSSAIDDSLRKITGALRTIK